jgi:alpha-beta hydrolase superfamily lysophospholipase
LDPGLNLFQKLMLAVLPRFAPDLRMGNGVKPQYLSHDEKVVRAYQQDRRVHDRISARLALFIVNTGRDTLAMAPQWKVPTLLMFAGDDRLVNPQGSRDFAKAAPKEVVTTVCFDKLYHEIFNEPDAPEVPITLRTWLDARF